MKTSWMITPTHSHFNSPKLLLLYSTFFCGGESGRLGCNVLTTFDDDENDSSCRALLVLIISMKKNHKQTTLINQYSLQIQDLNSHTIAYKNLYRISFSSCKCSINDKSWQWRNIFPWIKLWIIHFTTYYLKNGQFHARIS